jgi:hypothetical protein
MHMQISRYLALAALLALPLSRVRGSIMGTSGAVTEAAPPSNITTGNWQSGTQIRAFQEQQDYVLPQAVNVDITVPGTSPNSTSSNLSPGTISAGTLVNSYFLHFDPVGSPKNPVELTGSITLGEPIIGIIAEDNALTASNPILGMSNVTYPDSGLELNPAGGGTSDVVTWEANNQNIDMDWRASSKSDNMRIITEASPVPEPSTTLLPLAFAGYLLSHRRR